MDNAFSKLIAIIISFVLLFMVPMLYMFENQDETTKIFVFSKTTEFVDSIRNLGYVTPRMYEDYRRSLSATGNIYDVDIEHYHKSFDPIYDDPLIIDSFQKDYNINYNAFSTEDILNVLFPEETKEDRIYKLSQGDYILVTVKNKNKTMATKIQDMLYNADFPAEKIMLRYGGMVKDENY